MKKNILSRITPFALMLLTFAIILLFPDTVSAATSTEDSGYKVAAQQAVNWINVIGYVMLAGAGIAFLVASYQAFQREWQSALVAIIVCVILGFAPYVLKWVAGAWGFDISTSGAQNLPGYMTK